MTSCSAEQPPMATAAADTPADAKLMCGDCQRLKNPLMSNQQATATKKPTPSSTMNPLLLASSCSGSWRALTSLIQREEEEGATTLPPSSLLEGVTVEGDTALHVVATYGDDDDYLTSVDVIYGKAKQLVYALNNKDDTPLHCAARAGKPQMVAHLIALARGTSGDERLLVRKENRCKETALHEAVRVGSNRMVELLMATDPELACFPKDGTSPLYLAIFLQQDEIAQLLYRKSGGYLSYSGPNGQNALHAAALRSQVMTEMLLRWNIDLATQGDQNGSTPLHFATSLLYQRNVHFWFWILRPWFPCRHLISLERMPFNPLLQANQAPMYQPDNEGLFPIHIAASTGVKKALVMVLERCPNMAGFRDAKGRTFLHAAVEKKRWNIVGHACQTPSISWVLNMQDMDGNTALHLAVNLGDLDIFSLLLANRGVRLNLTNKNGETPLDLAESKLPAGFYFQWNPRLLINCALRNCPAKYGNRRSDHFEEHYIRKQKPEDEEKDSQKVTNNTQALGIGSALITTVAFGATFTLPGGYKDDGTPTLSGKYSFDAFIVANSLAFACSGLATINLVYSGMATADLPIRGWHFNVSAFLAGSGLTSLAVAFVLGLYLMLAPVAHGTAILICVLASVLSVYIGYMDPLRGRAVATALCLRLGRSRGLLIRARVLILYTVVMFWPMMVTFSWAAISTKYHHF